VKTIKELTESRLVGGDPIPARILLADDNPHFLSRIAQSLRGWYEILALVSEGEAIVAEAERLGPDVLVLDISIGSVNGIDVARRLWERGYSGKIVFLTVYEDVDFVRAALAAGGSAYVFKSRSGSDLHPAIEAALSNQLFISPPLGSG